MNIKTEENAAQTASLETIGTFVEEIMLQGGQVQKDKGRLEYKVEIHRALGAFALEKAMAKFNLSPTAANFRALLPMIDNHSAWRMKFEKRGIFPEKNKRPIGAQVDDYLAELTEEGVGE